MDIENQAIEFRQDKNRLYKYLKETKYLLHNKLLSGFGTGTFDFDQACLTGNNGRLQWKLRHQENEPVSYRNQQTNCGIVIFINNGDDY